MLGYLPPEGQLARAREVYRAALASPFYAEKYRGLPEPTDAAGWRRLPLLTHQEVLDNAFPRSTRMLTGPVEGMIVLSTGGSTGVARYTVMTHAEWDAFCTAQAGALLRLGVGPADRVANLFVAGHLWPSFLGVHEAIKRAGAVHLPISANIDPEEMVRLTAEFDPQVILTLPTAFVFLGSIARKHGYRFPSLRLIGYGGEQMSEPTQHYVRETLGVEQISALGYSSADAGLMGYQTPDLGFATYHVPTDFQLIEIIEPRTGEPCPPGVEGEVVVTNLARRSMPIIRYQVGDVATWLPEAPTAGDPNPLIRLGGRSGDDFKVGGGFIAMKVFDDALAAADGAAGPNYSVEVEDFGDQMAIHLLVEADDPARAQAVAPTIRAAILKGAPLIAEGIEKRYIRELGIRFVALGELPRSPITGKVRRLVDKRVLGSP